MSTYNLSQNNVIKHLLLLKLSRYSAIIRIVEINEYIFEKNVYLSYHWVSIWTILFIFSGHSERKTK